MGMGNYFTNFFKVLSGQLKSKILKTCQGIFEKRIEVYLVKLSQSWGQSVNKAPFKQLVVILGVAMPTKLKKDHFY